MQIPKNTHNWLQLIRPPNLITVPGDPLAGTVLAFAAGVQGNLLAAIAAAIVALLLYISGLIMNDYVDIEEDKIDRPDRPLSSGSISPLMAVTVAIAISLIAVAISFIINPVTGITAILLIITIALYNFVLKSYILVGSVIMGVCRGLSFLLGAFAVGYKIGIHSFTIILAVSAIILYIASVTTIAANETEEVYIGIKRWVPTAAIFFLLLIINPLAGNFIWLALLPGIAAIIISVIIAKQLAGEPAPELVQKSIGLYIRLLLLIQVLICFIQFPIGLAIGSMLLLFWPLGTKLAKQFYAS